MSLIEELFTSATATPHGYCLLWNKGLVTLHVLCDGLITLAYFMIPAIIYVFARKKHVENILLFRLFSGFILACALTHLMDIVVIWYPYYYLQGFVMAFSALVSLATVIALWQQMPELLKLPSLQVLQQVNAKLSVEIERRNEAEKNYTH